METIIVTGGAGYIGSHTIIELLNKTIFQIVSIDNFSNSSPDSYSRISALTSRPFETIQVDLCDQVLLNQKLSNYSNIIGIIHFAAFKSVSDSISDPIKYYHNNINSLNNILDFAKQQNVLNFIFSSSCSVYGNSKDLPVTENTPLQKAESPYGHTKQISEEIISFFCKTNPSFKTVLLRYFNPVGAHPSGKNGEFPINIPNNLVPIITQTAIGKNSLTVFGNDYNTRDGSCIRDYIHVCDIADAHLKALNYLIQHHEKKQCSLFNLGTGNGVSVLEAIKSFEKITNQKLHYKIGERRTGDVIAIYANNELAKTELNWTPQYNIDDMMMSAWKWENHLEEQNTK